jgi:hypothetical protein
MSDATMNAIGDRFEYRYAVADITNSINSLPGGQTSMGDGGDWGLTSGPEPFVYDGIDLTFYKGAADDNADGDATTFGFAPGRYYQIEGEFFNHFNLTTTTDGLVEGAFVFGATTSVVFYAATVPEPAAYASVAGLGALVLAASRRRRRMSAV